MKHVFLLFILFLGVGLSITHAQTGADRTVTFNVESSGISKTIQFGPDLAWANEQAFRRAILFMGLDQVDLVRASFQPTYPLVNGTNLTNEQIADLDFRLWLINTYVGPNTNLALNCDHPWVDAWYHDHPERWEQLIKVSAQRYEADGHNVVTVGTFNEPDYGWNQYTNYMDMYYITELLNNNAYFNGVRLSGGNTLNCDEAQGWYDFLIPAGVTEGNTHQLAGSFDGFASFYQNVRANGHHATGDELHNLMEALVGYEYGMQTGIWWADIDRASGDMVKAMDGERLGYAENRDYWTAAAVYRAPDGKVQAFMGGSERQAATCTYKFVSQNKAVFFDGHGPYYEYTMEYPGGAVGSYMNGQTNAERVIDITWGEDIQPVIDGSYIIVNRSNGQAMQVNGSGRKDGENVVVGSYAGSNTQKWNVTPVDPRVGGDFSYFRFNPASSSRMSLDLWGYVLDDGANIDIWATGIYGNHQWYLDYAEDGYFYIRSRESSKCLDVNEGNVIQNTKGGSYSQQWRLIPVGAPIEFVAPNAPTNLAGTGNTSSIGLSWTASSSSDVAGYTIFRKEAGGAYNTIARNVSTTSYEDFDVQSGVQYYYKIDAIDASLNRSSQTSVVGPLQIGSGSSGDPTAILVQSISTGTASGPRGNKYGTAVVTIVDDMGNLISGATVSGSFSGTFNDVVSGTTGASGAVSFQTSSYAKTPTVDFCVDNVTYNSLPYDPAQNLITCTNPALKSIAIGDSEEAKEISLFPNPVSDYLNISIIGDYGTPIVAIVDLSGRTLMNVQLSDAYTQLNLSSLAPGIYLVKIQNESGIIRVEKIVKK